MTYKQSRIGDFFEFRKGLGYLGKFLTSSDVALIGLNSFEGGGGGYKHGGEKEYSGPYRNDQIASPGDLFISTTDITQDGRVLASAFILPDLSSQYAQIVFSGDIVKATPKTDKLIPEFLFNVLRVKKYRNKAAYASTGSTVRRIPIEVIADLEVPVPNLSIQRYINSIIASLDEKILLNQKMTHTLELLAETIFKAWFVDFEPVHAKVLGIQGDGNDPETASLFSAEFENSPFGMVPAGWIWKELGDVINIQGGSTPSTTHDEYWGTQHRWTTPKDLSLLKSLASIGSIRKLTDKGLKKINSGPVPSLSVLLSCRAPIGYVAINDAPTAVNQGIIALTRNESFSPLFLANWLKSNMHEIENRAGGSSFAEISKSAIRTIKFLVPPQPLLDSFSATTDPILQELFALSRQSLNLEAVRESLLPRLISGELMVPEELLGD
jgi:restriction endonuclease S subunit